MKRRLMCLLMGIIIAGITACGGGAATSSSTATTETLPEMEASVTPEIESIAESSSTSSQGPDPASAIDNEGETQFVGVVEEGVFSITDVISVADEIIVPERIEGTPVGKIKKNAFQELTCKKIVLPNSITSIGKDAFMECRNLEIIDLGEGLKSIGALAFLNCTSLKTVSFPEGMETIKGSLFSGCDVIGDVFIPASVAEIPEGIGSSTTCPNLVIVTPAGSVAEEVAISQGIPVRNN